MNNEELSQMIDRLSQVAAEEVKKEYENKKEEKLEDIKIINQESVEEELISKIEDIQKNKEQTPMLTNYEKQYLLKIKERILVLFEALNTKQNEEDLQKRLEITISFIEFLLANIEERLKN
ncbi:hypothetical protein AVANS14531_06200 [Campylobacter sp. Cr9]|uniref:CiaD-like domain-containing protein n=1 Tax=unclassified Campylobacter TaxID=2593542 RepID=UPI001EFA953E|nr:hypothetical protein [Campylobacter sp. RM5004]MBZ7985923.1 hypothetical protein [Campylobacter sp. Cr9]ULO01746.1 invasion antigen D [Campylobacter sp. RM5004]